MRSRATIATIVVAALALAVAVAVAIGTAALGGTRALRSSLGDVVAHRFAAYRIVSDTLVSDLESMDALGKIMEADGEELAAQRSDLRGRLAAARKRLDEYLALPHGPECGPALEKFAETRRKQAAFEAEAEKVLDRAGNGLKSSLTALDAARAAFEAVRTDLTATGEADSIEAEQARHAAERVLSHITLVVALVAGLGSLLLVASGAAITRSIRRSIGGLVAEAERVERSVGDGQLDASADPSTVGPEFRPVVEAFNRALTAYVGPIRASAAAMDSISRGEIPRRIAEAYRGEFGNTVESLNRSIGAVNRLVTDVGALATAAVEGNLAARADPSLHQGEFRRIVLSVNRTLDSTVAPIEESMRVLERLAHRDLTARVTGEYRGDHARLRTAINASAEALEDTLQQVSEGVGHVADAGTQIASSAQSVAAGASEQASSLEETSSSLECMAETTRKMADHAQSARTLAESAQAAAQGGAASSAQMDAAMTKIREAANGTSQIVREVSEIAFQTNLLALNASIEAARAGAAGRGFAVVAEEVRSLALRAREASARTQALIESSVKEVGAGEEAARSVSRQLAAIVTGVSNVSSIAAEVAGSADEQSRAIEQINTSVAGIGNVTQQNAANAEQSSATAEQLSAQSQQLATLVGSFVLSRETAQRGASSRTRRILRATQERARGL